ncbi:acyl-CoA dehydrogenase family protein [Georgenia sp. AZ-5]|uniref:acyl-CoA dehydrogenase family protein n=1 Tax=Georgenia sp. AZ-5 TaxID=3367526 RepID=UPI003753F366
MSTVGTPLGDAWDLLSAESLISDDERAVGRRVRELVDTTVRPRVAEWYEAGTYPAEVVRELARQGLLGMHLDGYGCAARSAVENGLAAMELEAGDSGLRTFVSVHSALAMTAIHRWGSAEQRNAWLPRMAAGEAIGCFAITEREAGSDPAGMTTFARRDGGDWVITGTKRWITLASLADVAVVWAMTDDGLRGFLVPTDAPGYHASPIGPKLSLRLSVECDVLLDEVRLPCDAVLPGASGMSGPLSCLNEARYLIAWGVLGAARDSLDAVLRHAAQRRQFGKPLAAFQLTQQKLVDMALELDKGILLAVQLGRLKDAGLLRPHHISAGKLNNTREAIAIARQARAMLGGDGITTAHSPLRHASNLEAVRTYEGTDEVHTLVLGKRMTGLSAFA